MCPQIVARTVEAHNEFTDVVRSVKDVVGNVLRKAYFARPPSEIITETV